MGEDRWGVQRVREYAPDQRAFASAQRLARSGTWSDLGAVDAVLMGRCQGSGATPYQVTVDTSGPAVRCTCPSRKQPCKHGLALLLRWVTQGDGFASATASATGPSRPPPPDPSSPGPVAEQRAPDPEAQARRRARRIALMDAGMVELDRWLGDVMVDGLAAVRSRPHAWWDQMAARMVDAQIPGVADRIRALPGRISIDDGWASVLLAELGRLRLTAHAWTVRDQLDPDDAADLRTFLGWSRTADEVADLRRARGRWTVVGVGTSQTGRLTEQRTWLRHDVEGMVTMLDFAAGTATPPSPNLVGAVLTGPAWVYPGRAPRRIRFAEEPADGGRVDDLAHPAPGWATALASVSAGVVAAPWRDRFAITVEALQLVDIDADAKLVDRDGTALGVTGISERPTLAMTGGRPVTMFVELELGLGGARTCRPLSMLVDDQLVSVPAPAPSGGSWGGWDG